LNPPKRPASPQGAAQPPFPTASTSSDHTMMPQLKVEESGENPGRVTMFFFVVAFVQSQNWI